MLRISYVVVFLAGILLVLLPLGLVAFPWVPLQHWGLAGVWWIAVIMAVGLVERRMGK